MKDGLVSKQDFIFAKDCLLFVCNCFEIPNEFGLSFVFLLRYVLRCCVLFAEFAALGNIFVRFRSFPIFAWRKYLRRDQAQVEELKGFLNMPLDLFLWLVAANYSKRCNLYTRGFIVIVN